jgi:hypothetical protein
MCDTPTRYLKKNDPSTCPWMVYSGLANSEPVNPETETDFMIADSELDVLGGTRVGGQKLQHELVSAQARQCRTGTE